MICPSPFGRGWTQSRNVPSCCNKTKLTPSGPPNLVDPLPHNSLRIIGSPSWPCQFVHRFGGGRKCSSWALTPFSFKGLVKTYLWTLGLDPKLCHLEGHDAWKRVWRTTLMRGVLTPVIVFWVFGSPWGLPSPIFRSVSGDLTLPSR